MTMMKPMDQLRMTKDPKMEREMRLPKVKLHDYHSSDDAPMNTYAIVLLCIMVL
jgi:hypothetical protein